jgi:hypothetical protein
MKRLTTYYFLLLACFNVFLSLCLSSLTGEYGIIGEEGDPSLPFLLEWAFQRPLWPRIGVAVCVIGAVLSLLGKPNDNVLKNLLIVALIAELWGMFLTAITFL